MFLHVTKLSYLDDYRLKLAFNNSVVKIVDLYHELDGEIFEPLTDVVFFRQVYLNEETGTIEWPNGADFAPEFLFEIGEDVPETQAKYRAEELVIT